MAEQPSIIPLLLDGKVITKLRTHDVQRFRDSYFGSQRDHR
jgi:hypothetical protein